ncbi:hypothetical protein DsansV1_C01g0012101 [Dioscorea sansibarensis]
MTLRSMLLSSPSHQPSLLLLLLSLQLLLPNHATSSFTTFHSSTEKGWRKQQRRR